MVKLDSISKSYGLKRKHPTSVLSGVSAEIPEGTMTAIVGKSGIGKTTLLNIIGCLLPMDKGSYELDGKKIDFSKPDKLAALRNEKIGIVLQDFGLVPNYTVLENVMLPLYFGKHSLKEGKKKAKELLKKVGLEKYEKKYVSNLSGGQKQRVAICRALINDPTLIVADEPTGSLDSKTSAEIVKLLRDVTDEKHTVIIVTHDNDIAKQCDNTIYMDENGLHT